ncbi:PQQ-binding-like beta-propeller repeat protein [Streptomyces profundus]|uniref:outer membrane protein assembly factor BamB family protein n=1 Tax=Streptomyces profundus TaxID=2867410 RepID=UPI001D165F94|nr:PQQ-binding-like beta-propeller repeat protein [Streptomyces sp. MA3_2.13]UED84851.1 PQQ-binding-like beta-propeller repeat protein [Streptomyces sp. MA3_2.13]
MTESARQRRRRRLAVAGALLATVAATATVLVLQRGGGGQEPDGETPPEATEWERSWRAEEGFDVRSGQLTTLWATSELLAPVGRDAVLALDPSTGEPLWTFETPVDAGAICAASSGVNAAGLAAVAFEDAEHSGVCAELAIVDTADGQLRWRQRLVDTAGLTEPGETVEDPVSWVGITLADDWVGASVTPSAGTSVPYSYQRLDLADGARLPVPWPPEGCRGHSWAPSVEHTAVSYNCGETTDEQRNENNLQTVFDSATGEELWTRPVSELGGRAVEVLGSDPLTLLIDGEATTFDPSGGIRTRKPAGGHFLHPELAGDTALESEFDEEGRSHLRGHDLTSGELGWHHDYPGTPDAAFELGDGRLLVMHQGGELISLDLADGAQTPVGRLPADFDHALGYALTDTTLYLAVRVEALDPTVAVDAYPLPSALAGTVGDTT